MVELPRRVDGERWRFFLVERAQPGEVLRTGLLELNIIADNADNIRLLLEILSEVERRGHCRMIGLFLSITTAHLRHVNLDCRERLWKRALKPRLADLTSSFR